MFTQDNLLDILTNSPQFFNRKCTEVHLRRISILILGGKWFIACNVNIPLYDADIPKQQQQSPVRKLQEGRQRTTHKRQGRHYFKMHTDSSCRKQIILTITSMHLFSLQAPQQPKNAINAMRTPAAIITLGPVAYGTLERVT